MILRTGITLVVFASHTLCGHWLVAILHIIVIR